MILLALIFLAIVAFVIAAVAGIILNIVRAARGKARPLPKRTYWDPSHPRYREAHTVYLSTEPPAQN
jgi:hypothetical protein|nr:MAG TPA: hypothetical protein [Caudoviricetes sp.]